MKRVLIAATLCMAALFALSAPAFSSDGAALFARCIRCHGEDARKGAKHPGGQSAAEIQKKLDGYAAGTYGGEKKSVMEGMVKGLSPEDRRALAEHVAKL